VKQPSVVEQVEHALRASSPGPWNWGGPPGKYLVYNDAGTVLAEVQSGANDAKLIANARVWLDVLSKQVRELERREREWIPMVRERVQELEVCAKEFVPALLVRIRCLEETIGDR
jgi:hypothetical protein